MKRLIGIALLAGLLGFGQTERGNITGIVTDNSGATIPNAAVTITGKETNTAERVLSTSTGEYNAANLQPGAYRVEVSVSGFSTFVLDNVVLTAGATVRADAPLRVGSLSETVEVSAQPIQMQTEDARVSNAVQNRLVDELPLVVGGALRSPFDLVSTVPEAKGSGNALSLGGGPRLVGAQHSTDFPLTRTVPPTQPKRQSHPVSRVHHRILRRHERFQSRVRPGGWRCHHVCF